MSVSTGTIGVTATPATDLYNLIATALTNNGNWTETADSPVSAVNAATTGPVRCWKNNGTPNWFLMIEVDDTNTRLRIRAAEELGVGGGASAPAQYKVRKWVEGHSNNNTSTIANADTTGPAANADGTIGAANSGQNAGACVAYVEIKTPAGGYTYIYEARDKLLTIATRANSLNYYCVAGMFTSLVQSTTDNYPLFLAGHPYNPGILSLTDYPVSSAVALGIETNGCKSSRAPNCGGLTGSFWSWMILPLYGLNANMYMTSFYRAQGVWPAPGQNTSIFGAINGGTSHKYFSNPISSPAVVHGTTGMVINNNRTFRAYMPDFVAVSGVNSEPNVGDTLTVDGVTYYVLGWTVDGYGTYGAGYPNLLFSMYRVVLAIKG